MYVKFYGIVFKRHVSFFHCFFAHYVSHLQLRLAKLLEIEGKCLD
jgi:hypothetical protein